MSNQASSSSSDGASAAAATSPFSPHATAFGPSSGVALGTSNRIHGLASDGQSLSSRASSFTSAHDHASATAFKGSPATATNQATAVNVPIASFGNSNAASPSAAHFSIGDRIRDTSDHSRQSSAGAMSNFSASSAAANAVRRTQSPLHQQVANRNSFALDPHALLNQSQPSSLSAHSPTSLIPPQFDDDQQRRLSSSFGARIDSPSFAPTGVSSNSGRPSLGRQSISDGPSNSAASLLSSNLASVPMDARHGSFSGSFPTNEAVGQSDSLFPPGASGPAPSTGPLSASDPRTQLLVSNLPYRVRWQDLKDLFRKAGTVLRADVSLSQDNRSRGYGTVLMATEQDANKAADMLGGFTWQGRTLDVRVDRSGSLVGVAGSAVMPTLASNGIGMSPGNMGGGDPVFDQGFGQHQFLGVPSSHSGSQAYSPGSNPFGTSPSALSPLARAAEQHQALPSRTSFSVHSDAGLDGGASEFERAMLQGQSFNRSGGSATPSRSRPSSTFEPGSAAQGQHRAVSAVQSLNSNLSGSRRASEVGFGASASSSAVWGPGANDTAAGLYSQNAGGSSVPTGFPGATAMAPWPAGPGAALGGNGMASMQSQPFNSQMPTTSYAGRVLFVGNLPFHCQWQDLKDLFRAAGNIQRADVAIGPDGRSRGFGTVLFASQEDAQNAVRLYHGYEYSGRTLKVHFDRFAAQNGPAVGTPGNPAQYTGAFAAAALPSHMTNNVRAPAAGPQQMQAGFGQAQQLYQSMQPQLQQRGGAAIQFLPQAQQQGQVSFGQAALQYSNLGGQQYAQQYQPQQQQQYRQYGFNQQQPRRQQPQQQMGFDSSAFGDAGGLRQEQQSQQPQQLLQFDSSKSARQNKSSISDRRSSTAKPFGLFSESQDEDEEIESTQERHHGMSITLPANGGFGAASSYLPSDLMSPGLVSPPIPTQHNQGSHPGRIQLPSSNFSNSFGAVADQMSPMTARMQVPMTPGMPGFTFQQVPETPPLYPQFLSPGLGAFSPTIGGSAQMSQNFAPGAPVHATPGGPAGYNPMFPMSAAFGMQQGQPATPHWSQPSGPRRGGNANRQSIASNSSGAIGTTHNPEADDVVDGVSSGIAKTPGAGPRRPSHVPTGSIPGGGMLARRASDGTPGPLLEPSDGYPFPMVASSSVAHLTRRASTNSPAGTPLAAPGASSDNAALSTSTQAAGGAMFAASTEELANTIARLSVKGTALARDSGSRRSISMTAERSAAASAMAKLREKAGTPTPPAVEEGAVGGLGAPFSGVGGRMTGPPVEKLFGLKVSNAALEAGSNGSALDTGSEIGDGSSKKGTPEEEGGPHV